jgi:hypothetical protein
VLYPQGKSPWYPLDSRLGGHQSRSGRGGEENSQPVPGIEPPIIQPVAKRYTTELVKLSIMRARLLEVCIWYYFMYFSLRRNHLRERNFVPPDIQQQQQQQQHQQQLENSVFNFFVSLEPLMGKTGVFNVSHDRRSKTKQLMFRNDLY